MRIYLSGPMTGVPDHNEPAFAAAAARLRAMGHEVVSPAEETVAKYGSWAAADAADWSSHLLWDLAIIAGTAATCTDEKLGVDIVATLPGWERSRGATTEVDWAGKIGKAVTRLSDWYLDFDAAYRMAQDGTEGGEGVDVGIVAHEPAVDPSDERDDMAAFVAAPGFELKPGVSPLAEPAFSHGDSDFGAVVADPSGALKADGGKPDMSLLSYRANYATAEVLTFGATKYAAHNWRKGFRWGRTFAALQRHLGAWNDGEDLDPETGLSHLAHARCNLDFLLEFVATKTGTDDRYQPDFDVAAQRERFLERYRPRDAS